MKNEKDFPKVATNLVNLIPSDGIYNQRKELLKIGEELNIGNKHQCCVQYS